MANLNLDPSAKFFLSALQQQSKPIGSEIEQKIGAACEAKGAQPLTVKELQQLLVEAMPDQKQAISSAGEACAKSGYHSDGKKADFLTQFVGLHTIEKERAVAVRAPRPAPTNTRWTRDPLEAKFVVDNQAKSMMLFNGRDVDENGRPLLMKAVLRVSDPADAEKTKAEIEAFKKEMGAFAGFRTRWGEGAEKADIHIISKTDAYVEIKDLHEAEFAFGDPLLQVSRGADGKEISRGVAVEPENKLITKYFASNPDGSPNLSRPVPRNWNSGPREEVTTGHNLDTTAPAVFDKRIQMSMAAKADFPEGGWLETRAQHVEAKLIVEPGLVFEPGKAATVSFLGTNVKTEVASNDAFFTGSPSTEGTLNLGAGTPYANYSLKQVLTQNVARSVATAGVSKGDVASANIPAHQLIFAEAEKIKIGAAAFQPLADVSLKKGQLGDSTGVRASLIPISDDQKDGTRVGLALDKGFVTADGGASVKGWKVVVGFRDADGKWKQCDEQKIKSKDVSQEMEFALDMANAPALMQKGASLEIRVFNDNGVPAQRTLIPFTQIPWNPSVAQG